MTTTLAIMNFLVGLLVLALSIPLARRKVGMNRWHGMRGRPSFESEESWYRINEYGGKLFIYWSAALMAFSVLCLLVAPLAEAVGNGAAWISLVYLIPCLQTWRYSKQPGSPTG